MNICGYYPESINEGTGFRAVIFISGCKHNCKGCYSPLTHNFNYGELFTFKKQKQIIQEIKNNILLDGISLLGGDPMFSAKEVFGFIKLLKKEISNINIWCYTGFLYEDIINNKDKYVVKLLKECDILVDGGFNECKKDLTLPFRGSSNQRIIDIQKSLLNNKIIIKEI